ncbi:MAG: hypothetical protein JEZ01_04290 [Labilibaculum sp.]|nr:hypothetical protein [Labilibaculum sp.]MBI9056971.1 hypothetical protein [Labilibaculum sp.]
MIKFYRFAILLIAILVLFSCSEDSELEGQADVTVQTDSLASKEVSSYKDWFEWTGLFDEKEVLTNIDTIDIIKEEQEYSQSDSEKIEPKDEYATRYAYSEAESEYYSQLRKKYSEFNLVEKWFHSKPNQLLDVGENAKVFKVLNISTNKNGTVTHYDLLKKEDMCQYVIIAENAIYILKLDFFDGNVIPSEIKRISQGLAKESMHTLSFGEDDKLDQETFIGNVNPDIYKNNERLYFDYNAQIRTIKVINVYDLGFDYDLNYDNYTSYRYLKWYNNISAGLFYFVSEAFSNLFKRI